MQEKLEQIAASIKPFTDILKSHDSRSPLSSVINFIRSESSTRESYGDDQIVCVLSGIAHLENLQLDKPENNLNECVKWLDKAAIAYRQKIDPTPVEQLAEAVRLDIATQLFGFSGAHYYMAQQQVAQQLSVPNPHNKHELEKGLRLAKGLVGFLLGRSLEISQEAAAAYQKLQNYPSSQDYAMMVGQRQACLVNFNFIIHEELGMNLGQFQAIKENRAFLEHYVATCCEEGMLSIEKSESKLLHDVLYGAGLIAVFTFPVGLAVLVPALAATPFLYVWDLRANAKYEEENELIYHLITIAKEWTENYFANKRNQLYPNNDSLIEELKMSRQRIEELAINRDELSEKIRLLDNKIRHSNLGTPEQNRDLKSRNSNIDANMQDISEYCSSKNRLIDEIDSFIYYLNHPREMLSQQGQFKDMSIREYTQQLQLKENSLYDQYINISELFRETVLARSQLEQDYNSIKAEALNSRARNTETLEQVYRPFS